MSTCTRCNLPLAAADLRVVKYWVGRTGAPDQLWRGRLDGPSAAVCPACDAYSLGAERRTAAPFYLQAASAFATVHDGDWWNQSEVDTVAWPALGRIHFSPASLQGAVEFAKSLGGASPPPSEQVLLACGLTETAEWDAGILALSRELPDKLQLSHVDVIIRELVGPLAHLVRQPSGDNRPSLCSSAGMLPPPTVTKLRNLVVEYREDVDIPERDRWQTMDDAGVWRSVVSQVCVVGGVAGAERMLSSMPPDWYGTLLSLSPAERSTAIHAKLRQAGVRYVTATVDACRKTRALARNLSFLHARGGPKAYITQIAALPAAKQIQAVIRDLAFIKNKGARDFLMGLGLLRDAIALDVRVLNGLKAMGADLAPGVGSDATLYAQLEKELLEEVCRPMKVDGVVLDRIMFQKYNQIAPRRRAAALTA